MSGVARRAMSELIATSVAVALVGCGSNPPDAMPAPLLDGVTGELILTRQRDLLDRGLINVLTRNESESSMLLNDIELIADFFVGEPAAERTINLRSGRQVAIQVPYGTADDCDAEGPVHAELAFTYTTDQEREPIAARVDLDGTDILDTIRAQQCLTRRFEEATHTRFEGTEVAGGTVVTRLVIEPTGRGATAGLVVTAVSGTILVAARTSDDWNAIELDDEPVTMPLTFVVNRCDPHALAEVTKRYGLALAVSVDGAEPVTVAIDVSELVADLEAIVEQCTAATAGE